MSVCLHRRRFGRGLALAVVGVIATAFWLSCGGWWSGGFLETPPSWIFKFVKFHWQTVSRRHRLIIMLNVVKIGRLLWRYCNFSNFQNGRGCHLGFFEIEKFYWLLGRRGLRCISMPNFVKIGQSVAKILIFFKMASVRHLAFVRGIIGPTTVSTWGSLSLCKIWLSSMQ